jgi:transposase
MQDRELYERILGIASPWFVDRVELKAAEGEVRVWLAHRDDAEWTCPECGRACPLHDHAAERTWRHLDTCQYRTLLHATPRTNRPEHGVRAVRLPWTEPYSHFTLLFERLAIDWLQAASQQAVAERLGLSWDEVHGIMQRAVKRGLARREAGRLPRIGVDEKAFRKGHRYVTLVNALGSGRVWYVPEDLDGSGASVLEDAHRGTNKLD